MKPAACILLSGLLLFAAQSPQAAFEQAARDLASGDYTAAERGFDSVLKAQPGNVAALSNLGVIYAHTGRADRAIWAYRKALRLSPDDQAVLLNLGLVYLKQEAHRKALPLFARAVKINPENLQTRQLLAVCRIYTGETAEAIQDLTALSAKNPRDENVLFLLGFAYLKDKNAEQSKAIFGRMLEQAGPARAQFLEAQADYEATLFPEASAAFQKVLALDPKYRGVHLQLGKVYISLRQEDDALRELKLALGEDPNDLDAVYFMGGLLVQQGQFADGVPYLERARKAKPDFWAPYFYLGKAKLRLGQAADAVELLQRAVELNPDESSVEYQLARALEACGRKNEAAAALRRVRELKAAELQSVSLDDGKVAGAH